MLFTANSLDDNHGSGLFFTPHMIKTKQEGDTKLHTVSYLPMTWLIYHYPIQVNSVCQLQCYCFLELTA